MDGSLFKELKLGEIDNHNGENENGL